MSFAHPSIAITCTLGYYAQTIMENTACLGLSFQTEAFSNRNIVWLFSKDHI